MQGSTSALDFFEDVGSGRGPDEGLGTLVVLGDVVLNGCPSPKLRSRLD